MYGAAPIPLELLRQAVETISNADFLQCYGMTETTGTIAMLRPEDHSLEDGNPRMRSAGKALPGVELKIVGEDGQELPRGQVGEVVTRSSNNMLGYWNLPEATASTLTEDNWVHTGDAAYMDEHGYIYIQDRIKDMIITGGENVYPAEVESAIYGHPDVAEVAVIGVPDAKWGEAVKACVVPRDGREVDPANVIAWARERIAPFKVPKSVDVIPLLPRNPSGKILRRQLREPYWEGRERRVN
jgi:fatty-acyl-CoA synthase